MLNYTRIDPLTPEESRYAAEHFPLVHSFLKRTHLPEDDFFDIVIFGYLYAVKRYLTEEKLSQWKFTTIAWKAMRRSVGHYWASRRCSSRNAVVCSLDMTIPGSHSLSLYEVLPGYSQDMEAALEEKMAEALLASQLTREQRKVISMRDSGWNEVEIARSLCCPPEELESQSERIRDIFKKVLDIA